MTVRWNKRLNRYLRLLVFPVFVVALSISIMGSTHSWFFGSEATEDSSIDIGNIQLSADAVVYPLPAGTQAVLPVSISSRSTVDFYLRIGVTIFVTDSAGKELPAAIPDDLVELSLENTHINGQSFAISPQAVGRVPANGYDKEFITFLDSAASRLLVFPAGAEGKIGGTLTVRYNTEKYPAYFNGSMGELSLALVPEGIQATRSAVTALAGYGWDPGQVGPEGTYVQ